MFSDIESKFSKSHSKSGDVPINKTVLKIEAFKLQMLHSIRKYSNIITHIITFLLTVS